MAVYHLGNNGTARKLLKEWPLTQVGWGFPLPRTHGHRAWVAL
jgi:hypothetical protein